MVARIVLTTLDGGLLGQDGMDLTDASALRPVMAKLQAKGIAVILMGDRTRQEMEPLREQLGITAPFISESGSAIFTLVDHNPFNPALGDLEGNYFVAVLGCPYVQARAGLRVIANEISHPLKGFGDFTVEQLQRVMQLSAAAAHGAKAREFSEPFMTPKSVERETLTRSAEDMGFKLRWREADEGRFSELLGSEAGLGAAAITVVEAYQGLLAPGESLEVLGISPFPSELDEIATALSQAQDEQAIAVVNWTAKVIQTVPEDWLSAVAPWL